MISFSCAALHLGISYLYYSIPLSNSSLLTLCFAAIINSERKYRDHYRVRKIKINSSHWVIIIALLAAAYACYLLIEPYVNSIRDGLHHFTVNVRSMSGLKKKIPNKANLVSLLSCDLNLYYCYPFTGSICSDCAARLSISQTLINGSKHMAVFKPCLSTLSWLKRCRS